MEVFYLLAGQCVCKFMASYAVEVSVAHTVFSKIRTCSKSIFPVEVAIAKAV